MNTSILPRNIREEFIQGLMDAKGAPGKRKNARVLSVSRLIIKEGNSWWNEHRDAINAELDLIEGKVQ